MIKIFIGFGVAILVLGMISFLRWTYRWPTRAQEKLLREKTSPEAEVRGCCMIRENYYEMPGVAQVIEGMLGIYSVLGDVIEIPLPQMKLLKVNKNEFPLGRYPWWGKTCFWLESPKTTELALGVDDPDPWQRVFHDHQIDEYQKA